MDSTDRLLPLLVIAVLVVGTSAKELRFEDQPFSSHLQLLGRNVTCGQHVPGKFPSKTWSCNDLKIDGDRLIFTYFPGPGASITCGEEIGRNDIAQLCQHLLRAHGIRHKLWSAYASKASCGWSEDGRVYFMRMKNEDRYDWVNEVRGKGYIISLQCTVLDE